MVTHYQSEQGVLGANSFVGVTEVLAQSFPTTHFLKMLMKQIKEEHTALEDYTSSPTALPASTGIGLHATW